MMYIYMNIYIYRSNETHEVKKHTLDLLRSSKASTALRLIATFANCACKGKL